MMSDLPKVAHTAAGRTLIGWVLEAVRPMRPASTVVVVGHGAEEVNPHLPADVVAVVQQEQLGTGLRSEIGLDVIGDVSAEDTILVLYGDVPLLTGDLLERLADRQGRRRRPDGHLRLRGPGRLWASHPRRRRPGARRGRGA